MTTRRSFLSLLGVLPIGALGLSCCSSSIANELAESSWQEVVGAWGPRLAPGIAAAGLHGVIRVGHAVCSLRAKENALRIDELARALSYWASGNSL